MSFNVLVISEDPTNNGYILKPLIEKIMKQCNKPNAKVEMLSKPRPQGYANAKSLIKEFIIDNYNYKDLLLFLPDADGKDRSKEFVELSHPVAIALLGLSL